MPSTSPPRAMGSWLPAPYGRSRQALHRTSRLSLGLQSGGNVSHGFVVLALEFLLACALQPLSTFMSCHVGVDLCEDVTERLQAHRLKSVRAVGSTGNRRTGGHCAGG